MVRYHAPQGYMTYELFYKIMRDVFVKYVEMKETENMQVEENNPESNGEQSVVDVQKREVGRGRKRANKEIVATEELAANERNTKNTKVSERIGRKRGNETGNTDNAKRSRTAEDPENVQINSDIISVKITKKTKQKRGRKRPVLYKGLLTCSEGLDWLKEFEETHKAIFEPQSTVSLQTTQGPIVLDVRVDESDMGLADKEDYFTVTKNVADEFFNVPEDPP